MPPNERDRAESACTPVCWATVECVVCGKRKKPWGRSAPLPMAASLCDRDCDGYADPPHAGHHWPGEECDYTCPK